MKTSAQPAGRLRPQFGFGSFSLAGPAVQAKLRVSQSDDAYEREADQVADAVVSSNSSSAAPPRITPRAGGVLVLRHTQSDGAGASLKPGGEIGGAGESQVRGLLGGQPLPEQERSFFESRMGRDFSGVRFHTGAEAQAALAAGYL